MRRVGDGDTAMPSEAGKAERAEKKDSRKKKPGRRRRPLQPPRATTVAAVFVAMAIGAVLGFLNAESVRVRALGSDAADSAQVIAVWSYDGKVHDLTMADYNDWAGLDASNTTVPGAESVLSYVRNTVLAGIAADEGIEATDDDVEEFAERTQGGSVTDIAEATGMSEDDVREALHGAAVLWRLREKHAGVLPDAMPAEPEAPADGNGDTVSADYLALIREVAGDAMNDDGTWADPDGDLAQAAATGTVTADGASYTAAKAVWDAEAARRSALAQTVSGKWDEWERGVFAGVGLDLKTVVMGADAS